MPRTVAAYKVGLFALVCGIITVAALVWLGLYSHFQERKTYAAYFAESVKGLQRDAIVNYKGVSVGYVEKIALAPDGRLVEVLVKLNSNFKVDNTVALQLQEQGLTGLRYLEITTAPDNIAELSPEVKFHTPYPVLQTFPSELEQLKVALQNLYQKVSSLDIETLTSSWTKTAELVNNLLVQFGATTDAGDVKDIIASLKKTAASSASLMERLNKAAAKGGMDRSFQDLSATLAATRQASENLARQIGGLPPDVLKQLSSQMSQTVKTGETVISSLQKHIGDSSSLFERNLQQLQLLLVQLNSLVQSLRDQPNRLVFPTRHGPDPFDNKK